MELSINIKRWHNPNNLPVEHFRDAVIFAVAAKQLIHEAEQVTTRLLFTWVDASEEHNLFLLNVFWGACIDFIDGDVPAFAGFPDA